MAENYTYTYCTRSRIIGVGIAAAVLICAGCACAVILSPEAFLPWLVLFWCVFGTWCIICDVIRPKTWRLVIQNGALNWETPRQAISSGCILLSEIKTALTSDGEIPVCILVLSNGVQKKLPANCIGNLRVLEAALIQANPEIRIAPLNGNS